MTALHVLFMTISIQYSLPSGLLEAVCFVESNHKVNAVHKDDGGANSLGVCQIKLNTAKDLGFKGTEKQLMNPKTNIKYAAKYLRHQLNRYKGSITKAVIAYNLGHASGLTTTKYQRKVFKKWR